MSSQNNILEVILSSQRSVFNVQSLRMLAESKDSQKMTKSLHYYVKEGKRQLIISIGCTGGRHRSVAIANALYERLKQTEYEVTIEHRDINEDVNRGARKL